MNSYEELRDHAVDCRDMAKEFERRAKSFSAWLFKDRDWCRERAAYWRERQTFWDARIKESFEAGEASRSVVATAARDYTYTVIITPPADEETAGE